MTRSRQPTGARSPASRLALLLALGALLGGISAAAPPAAPPARTLDFAALDGSSWDADGAADGVWTWPEALTLTQPLSCRGDAGAGCAIHLAVAGDLVLESGASLDADGRVKIEIAGDLRLGRGAIVGARGGEVEITASGGITIDGVISGGPGRDGGRSGVTIASLGGPGHGIRLGATATVISEAGERGGNAVQLSGCGIEVRGLVAALAEGPDAAVVMRSCEELVVDGRDLERAPTATEGDRLGRIEVEAGGERARIELAAAGSVTLDGSVLRAGGGPATRIDVAAEGGRLSWRGGRGRVGPAADGGEGGRIRLAACEGIALGGTELDPWSELALVDRCAPDEEAEGPRGALQVSAAAAGGGGAQATPSCTPDLFLANQTVSTIQEHVACNSITAENYRIIPRGFVTFRAGQLIALNNGFEVVGSAQFRAILDPTLNQSPTITSSATPSVPENQTAVIDVQATDPEGDTEGAGLSYAITGGADQALFSIVPATGVLTFNAAPDFEAPGDANADNVYEVQVTVTDSGGGTGVQDLMVTVTDVNEPPTITSSATPSVPENQTGAQDVQSTDPEGDTEGSGLTYAITGGADQASFSIVPATGVLTFNMPPDFEAPGDANTDNVYEVQVTVTDSGALTDVQDLMVTVTDANDKPTITSSATPSAAENQTAVIDVQSTDDNDTEGSGLTYAITGGADQMKFSIVAATGVLTFNAAPNFEMPGDANTDNVYEVQVTVTDSGALTDVQDLQVTVTDVNEPPTITSSATPSVPENQTAVIDVQSTDPEDSEGSGLSYAITGGADQLRFSIVPATGVLSFNMAPDFESPGDADSDNVYEVQVTVTDSGALTDVQDLQVTVTNVNEPPTAAPDGFDHVGNTLLLVDKPASVPAAPEVRVVTGSTFGVLDNDSDPEAAALSVTGIVSCGDTTAPFDCPTANGGAVTMESNGRFSFVPKTGDTMASDSFQYNASDGTNTAAAIVTLTRKNRVWYVQNDNASGTDDGSSGDPFDTLAEAEAAAVAGDTIYVFEGDGTTTGQGAGITLKDNQRFLGEGVDLAVPDTVNGVAGPTLFDSVANNQAKVTNGAGAGVAASNVSVEIRGLELTGSTSGIDLDASAGLRKVTVTDNSITGSTAGHGFDADSTGTGNLELVFDDNVVVSGDTDGTGTAFAGGSFTAASFNVASGNLVVTSLSDNGVGDTMSSVETGLVFDRVVFDADPSNGTVATGGTRDTVMAGALVIGDSGGGNRAMGPGLVLKRVQGDLDFTSVDVFNSGGYGITLDNAGFIAGLFVLTIDGGTVDTLDGGALDLDPATVDVTLASVTTGKSGMAGFATPSVRLVDLVNGPGGVGVDINGGALAGSSAVVFVVGDGLAGSGGTATIAYDGTMADGGATSVVIQDRPAGAGNVTLAGAIGSMATPVGGTIVADDNAAGTITFSGAVNLSTGSDDGVALTDNGGATILFTGGLDIDTTTGDGFKATGGGTVEVLSGGVSTTVDVGAAAHAVDLNGVTIGVGDVSFDSINATGTTSDAIDIDDVSNAGTFNGGATTINGTIAGDCIDISGATSADVAFASLTLDGCADNGVDFDTTGSGDLTVTGTSNLGATTGIANASLHISAFGGGGATFGAVNIDNRGGVGVHVDRMTGTTQLGATTIDNQSSSASSAFFVFASGGSVTCSSLTVDQNGLGNAVFVLNTSGAVDIQGSGSSITDAGGDTFRVDGGAADVAYAGTISNTASLSVYVHRRLGGTVTFAGAIDDDGRGIFLDDNGTGTVRFRGGMALDTGAFPAFVATNGGTVEVCATADCASGAAVVNSIGGGGAISGAGVSISGMTFGAAGVTFSSIASTGGLVFNGNSSSSGSEFAAQGGAVSASAGSTVVIDTTASGSANYRFTNMTFTRTGGRVLTVGSNTPTGPTGGSIDFDGTTTLTASGGDYGIKVDNSDADIDIDSVSISGTLASTQETRLASFPTNEGTGDGIFLEDNGGSFTLRGGSIMNTQGEGIDTRRSADLTLDGVTIDGTATLPPAAGFSAGLRAVDSTGSNRVTGCTFRNFETAPNPQAILILSENADSIWAVDNTLFDENPGGAGATATAGIQVAAGRNAGGAADITISVQGSTFRNIFGDGFLVTANDVGWSGEHTIVIRDSTFGPPPAGAGTGLQIDSIGAGKYVVDIDDNDFDTTGTGVGRAINLSFGNTGFLQGSITRNTIDPTARRGIEFGGNLDESGSVDLLIDDNDFRNMSREGMIFVAEDTSPLAKLRITDNRMGVVSTSGTGLRDGIIFQFRDGVPAGAGEVEVLIHGNEIDATRDAIEVDSSTGGGDVALTITGNNLDGDTDGGPTSFDDGLDMVIDIAAATVCLDLDANTGTAAGGGNAYDLTRSAGTFSVEGAGVGAVTAAALGAGAPNPPNNTGSAAVAGTINFNNSTNCSLPDPALYATAGSGQSTTVSTAFATNLQVKVVDDDGDPPPANTMVTFTAPASGASGTFPSGNTALTNAAGVASVPFTANGTAGTYVVTATAATSTAPTITARFVLTNTP